MIQKPIESVTKDDLEALVNDRVREDRSIEYKEMRVGTSIGEKKEFLFDLSALANAGGGDLVLGVVEERDEKGTQTGYAKKITGIELDGTSTDTEITRIESMVRTGIDPRLPIRIKLVEGFSKGPAIVIRAPRTFNGPRMVTFNGTNKFYSRSSGGKFLIDVAEIRDAFNAVGAVAERIRRFRDERISLINSGNGPALLSGPYLALHIIPLSWDQGAGQVDPRRAKEMNFVPIDGFAITRRFNLDGYYAAASTDRGTVNGYVQVFRTGAVEAVRAFRVGRRSENDEPDFRQLYFDIHETEALGAVKTYIDLLAKMDVLRPTVVLWSAVGVKGFYIYQDGFHANNWRDYTFDRDTNTLPEAWVDEGDSLRDALRPTLEAFWQAAGHECDPHFETAVKKAGID